MKVELKDILKELNIDSERFQELNKDYINSLDFKPALLLATGVDEEEVTNLVNHYAVVTTEYHEICKRLATYYYNKVYKDKWCISTEDIARHLDLSINFIQTNLIEKIDRIEFPGYEYAAKDIIKKYISMYMYTIYNEHPNYFTIKKDFKSKFRKKVLYSQESYIEFLKENMVVVEDNKVVKMNIPDRIIELGKKKFSKYANVEDKFMVETLFKFFLQNNKNDIKKHSINRFDFKGMLNARFEKTFDKEIDYCGDFKSKSSLKTLFNKVYEIEVDRIIAASSHDSIVFELCITGKKNPAKRFLLNKDFLIQSIKENLLLDNEIIEDDKSKLYKVTVPAHYFQKKFKADVKLLENEFLKTVELIIK